MCASTEKLKVCNHPQHQYICPGLCSYQTQLTRTHLFECPPYTHPLSCFFPYETVPRETIGIAWGVAVLRFGDMGDEKCSARFLSSGGNQCV